MERKKIIQTIQQKYLYFDCLEKELKNRLCILQNAKNDKEYLLNLQILLDEFLDPHTKIIHKAKMNYILPIYLGIIDEQIVVIQSDLKYPNIKKGAVLEAINFVNIKDLLLKYTKMGSNTLKLMKILELISSSEKSNDIILTFKSENSKSLEQKIEYIGVNSIKYDIKKYSNLSMLYKKEIEQKHNVSYYCCPSLLNDKQINILVESLKSDNMNDNVIFDIRNNMGGKIELAIKLTELFINEKTKIFMKSRKDMYEYVLTPQNSLIRGKNIGILFNNLTCSSLEFVFLRLLMGNDNILFMGRPTCGMSDVASIYNLSDNYIMSLTTKKYVDFNGKDINIKNINPYICIDTNLDDVIENEDTQLKKAIYFLKNQ